MEVAGCAYFFACGRDVGGGVHQLSALFRRPTLNHLALTELSPVSSRIPCAAWVRTIVTASSAPSCSTRRLFLQCMHECRRQSAKSFALSPSVHLARLSDFAAASSSVSHRSFALCSEPPAASECVLHSSVARRSFDLCSGPPAAYACASLLLPASLLQRLPLFSPCFPPSALSYLSSPAPHVPPDHRTRACRLPCLQPMKSGGWVGWVGKHTTFVSTIIAEGRFGAIEFHQQMNMRQAALHVKPPAYV